MSFPKNLKYTKDHEWISTNGTTATVGVTAYAIEQLGDIVHVELPEAGKSFAAGASFGTIESTKTVSDLYMPVACKIVEVNKAVIGKPESLQSDAYQAGWLIKVELSSPSDVAALLSADAYEKFISEQ
jgi:glycine cleavage system H protein